MLQAGCLHQFHQRVQGAFVKHPDPLGLVVHHQRLLAQRVLRGHAGRALAGVASLRLYAAQRKHETTRRVDPVGAQRHHAGNVKSADHLAGAAELDTLAQARADQGVVHQAQAFLHGRAHVVAELDRCRAGAAFGAIHHDEVRRDAGLQHGLDDGKPFPRMTQAELEADRFAAAELAQPGDELEHFHRG